MITVLAVIPPNLIPKIVTVNMWIKIDFICICINKTESKLDPSGHS